jgi:hypothetical protein
MSLWRKSWMSRQHVSHNDSNTKEFFTAHYVSYVKSSLGSPWSNACYCLDLSPYLSHFFYFLPLSFSCSSFYVFLFYLSLGRWWGCSKQRTPSSGYVLSTSISAIGLPFARFPTYSFGITRNVKNVTKAPVYKFLHIPCDSLSDLPCFRINREQTRRYVQKFSPLLQQLSPQHSVPDSVE